MTGPKRQKAGKLPGFSDPLTAVPTVVTASLCGIPLEVKLVIFDILAMECRNTLATVCRLSREFGSITPPLLYEEVLVWSSDSLRALTDTMNRGRLPASFYRKTVKSLLVYDGTSYSTLTKDEYFVHLEDVLRVCSNITTLAIRHSRHPIAPILARHCTKLNRLFVPAGSLLDAKEVALNARTLALFSKNRITHLRIVLPQSRNPNMNVNLTSLSCLTHLHVETNAILNSDFSMIQDLFQNGLTLPPTLRVSILTAHSWDDPPRKGIKQAITSTYKQYPNLVLVTTDYSLSHESDSDEEPGAGRGRKLDWYIEGLVPAVEDDEGFFVRSWTLAGNGFNIWDVAERLIASRGGPK